MKKYKIACTTRAGDYIEAEQSASGIISAIGAFIYDLALTHQVLMDDVVELDLTEVQG
jgi:hypothetical protein